jgi:hypothetical protein
MPLLQREGMRRINRKRKEFAELFGAVEKQLLASYKAPTDPIREDIAAWLCKTLAVSHDMKFAPTLTKVAQETSSKKVKRAAENGLDTLQDPPDEEDEAEEPSAEAAE